MKSLVFGQALGFMIGLAMIGCVAPEEESDEVVGSDQFEGEPQEDADERPMYPKYDALHHIEMQEDCGYEEVCGGGGSSTNGGGVSGGSTPTVTSIFVSSVGLGASYPNATVDSPIRDLKFTKGSSANQPVQSDYVLLNLDLNKGAGGHYIYLTFSRRWMSGPYDYCWVGAGEYVTDIIAEDFGTGWYKGQCYGAEYEPIWEPSVILNWKHPDLNDGSGGRYIFAWQEKNMNVAPIKEVGVVAGNSGSIQCPAGWTRVEQDLNQGAGGDYIFFCYKK